MSRDPIPPRLRERLAAAERRRQEHARRIVGRGPSPEPGDLYLLPCHLGIAPLWLVVGPADHGTLRLVPGDERQMAGFGDLWVEDGERELCFRLRQDVCLPPSALVPAARIGALPEAPAAIHAHEADLATLSAPTDAEDPDLEDWRADLRRVARALPRYLQEGVLALEPEDFGLQAGVSAEPPVTSEAPRLAAAGNDFDATVRRAMRDLGRGVLVARLDFRASDLLVVVTSRGLMFVWEAADPPPLEHRSGQGTRRLLWQLAREGEMARAELVVDWRLTVPVVRVCGPEAVTLEVRAAADSGEVAPPS